MESEKPNKRPRIRVIRSDANQADGQSTYRARFSNNDKAESASSYSGYRANSFNNERSLNASKNYNATFRQPSTDQQQHDGNLDRPAGGFGRPVKSNDNYKNNFKARPAKKDFPQKKRHKTEPIEYDDSFTDPGKPLRLNKYLANAGVCSRRDADVHIQGGEVKVNGVVVTELGAKVFRDDFIIFRDKPVSLEKKVYVLLNKPKGFVTTSEDPEERKTVLDLVKTACRERIYPVGRLDRSTTGVLLLTNDGDLASKLTHPKYNKKKIYHVWLDKDVTMEHLEMIAEGIELEDGNIHADAISYASEEDYMQVGIEIHSGRNRIVRRIFEHLGYKVMKLDRVYFAGLTKKNLSRGKWRYLSQEEVNVLKMGSFE